MWLQLEAWQLHKVGAGFIKIKTKLSPQLGLAKLELELSLAMTSKTKRRPKIKATKIWRRFEEQDVVKMFITGKLSFPLYFLTGLVRGYFVPNYWEFWLILLQIWSINSSTIIIYTFCCNLGLVATFAGWTFWNKFFFTSVCVAWVRMLDLFNRSEKYKVWKDGKKRLKNWTFVQRANR